MTHPPKSSELDRKQDIGDLDSDWLTDDPGSPPRSLESAKSSTSLRSTDITPSNGTAAQRPVLNRPGLLSQRAASQREAASPRASAASTLARASAPPKEFSSSSPPHSSKVFKPSSVAPGARAEHEIVPSNVLWSPSRERTSTAPPRPSVVPTAATQRTSVAPEKPSVSSEQRASAPPPRPSVAPMVPTQRTSVAPEKPAGSSGRRASSGPLRPSVAPLTPSNQLNTVPPEASREPRASLRPVSHPPRPNPSPASSRAPSELFDEPPDSRKKPTRARETASVSDDVVAARASEVASSSATEPGVEISAAASGAEPSAKSVSLDLASTTGRTVTVETDTSHVSVGESILTDVPVAMSGAPPRQPKRRSVLFGGVGVIVAAAIVSIAGGVRTKAPRVTPLRASPMNVKQVTLLTPIARALAPTSVHSEAHAVAAPASAAPAEEEAQIAINIAPEGSSVFYKGKVVGKTPFILKQPRGEKRYYEVGKAGFNTRRLVVTGTEREIRFELGMSPPHPDGL